MAEKETKTAEEKLDAITAHLDSLHKKMDAADEERKMDKAKMDAYCAKADAADEERKMDKAKKDAEMAASDKAKKDAEEKEEKEAKEKKDAEEMKAKKDAEDKEKEDKAKKDAAAAAAAGSPELLARLSVIERFLADPTSEERKVYVDAWTRAEPVYQAFGDSNGAPRFMPGEASSAYRRRLLSKFKAHSAAWKEKDLIKVDESVLDIAESQIYADAMKAALHPVDLPAGTLREIRKTDHAGRTSYEFVGDEKAAWAPFSNGGYRGRFVRPTH